MYLIMSRHCCLFSVFAAHSHEFNSNSDCDNTGLSSFTQRQKILLAATDQWVALSMTLCLNTTAQTEI